MCNIYDCPFAAFKKKLCSTFNNDVSIFFPFNFFIEVSPVWQTRRAGVFMSGVDHSFGLTYVFAHTHNPAKPEISKI